MTQVISKNHPSLSIDDLDDFIEKDDPNNPITKEYLRRSQPAAGRLQDLSTDPNLDSYRLAVEVFGEDFDANDFDFTKPFAVDEDDDEYQNEAVSEDSPLANEDYSDEYFNNHKVTNRRNIIKKSIHEVSLNLGSSDYFSSLNQRRSNGNF